MEEKLQKFSDARGVTTLLLVSLCMSYLPMGPSGDTCLGWGTYILLWELMGGPSVMPLDTASPTSCCSRLETVWPPQGTSWISVGQPDFTFLLGHAHPTSWHKAGKQFSFRSPRPLLPPNQGNLCFLRKHKHEILCAGPQRGPTGHPASSSLIGALLWEPPGPAML